MARSVSGVYTLPAGNPVVSGTDIESTWANDTMADLAAEITNSLDRSGRGGMLAAFKAFAGTVSAPGVSWSLEPRSGWYRAGSADFRFSIDGVDVFTITEAGASSAVGYIPQVLPGAGTYTLALTDLGKHIRKDDSLTVTVPPFSSVPFEEGATVSVVNNSGSSMTVAAGVGVTIYLAGSASTGNRTIAQRGILTLLNIATDTWIAAGPGVG